jgi:RNA polymerase sigma-70 factor (ECF subfamily)
VIAGVVMKALRRGTKPSLALVDDLIQETYLKLFHDHARALRRLVCDHENAFYGFLKVVAANTVRDHFRGAVSKKRGSGVPEIELDGQVDSSLLKSSSPDVERSLLLQAIERCLETDPAYSNLMRDRVIFWLYYKHGLTAQAISRLPSVGLTVKGVESALLRMIQHIRLKFNAPPVRCATVSLMD